MKLKKKFTCPENCACYYCDDGACALLDVGENPLEKCRIAQDAYEKPDGYPYYWEDENGNTYDAVDLLEKGYHIVNDEVVSPLSLAVQALGWGKFVAVGGKKRTPMQMSNEEFLDWASDKFNISEWERLCNLLTAD